MIMNILIYVDGSIDDEYIMKLDNSINSPLKITTTRNSRTFSLQKLGLNLNKSHRLNFSLNLILLY